MAPAFSKALTASLLLSLLLLHLNEAHQTTEEQLVKEGANYRRGRISARARACGSCCDTCKCVPPGTSGNLEVCPCYANLTTRNQIRKCP